MSISRLQTLLHYFHFEKIVLNVIHSQWTSFGNNEISSDISWGTGHFTLHYQTPYRWVELGQNDLNEWKAENYVLGKAQENIKLLIKLRHKNQIWCSKLLSYVFKFERINQNDRQSDYFRPFSQVYFIISACLQSKKYRNPHAFSAV